MTYGTRLSVRRLCHAAGDDLRHASLREEALSRRRRWPTARVSPWGGFVTPQAMTYGTRLSVRRLCHAGSDDLRHAPLREEALSRRRRWPTSRVSPWGGFVTPEAMTYVTRLSV